MRLTGKAITEAYKKGEIFIDDFDASKVGANSYDLCIGGAVYTYSNAILDLATIKENRLVEYRIPEEGILLRPNTLYLARTLEYTETKAYIPHIDGRSSIGRAGMFIHVTAGFGDIGFCGYWTLEIMVVQPLRIYAHQPICQISYEVPYGEITPYAGKYQDNKGVQGSQFETVGLDKPEKVLRKPISVVTRNIEPPL